MKTTKIITLLTIALLFSLNGIAQIQKAANAVFSLTTFNKDGSILQTGHGVFISNDGEAISTWKPFVGAAKAVVIDAKGRKMDVKWMMGANEIYDVCKFKVDGKTSPAPIAKLPSKTNNKVWLVGYSLQKPDLNQRSVQSVEEFMNKYSYYIFANNVPSNSSGCPFVNQKGEIIGLLQYSKDETSVFATDSRFINTFKIEKGLSINDPILKQTGIRIALPDDLTEATLALMLSSENDDSLKRVGYIDDFITKFPSATDGYYRRAINFVNTNDFESAAKDMETGIKNATKKDEAHYDYSKLIFDKEIYKSNIPYQDWSLEKSLEEILKAYEINPLPIYKHQQAQIVYAQKEYQKAYDMFMMLTKSPIRNGEIFYEAAQCKIQLQAPQNEIRALLDSAVYAQPKQNSAPYYLARGQYLALLGETRQAVNDFDVYDTLVVGNGTADFYFMKYQEEVKLRRYQQALNDIAHAIILKSNEPTYYAEMANLQLKVNQLDNAIKTADICINIAPEYTDSYIIKGLAMIQNKQVKEGREVLLKAKELGDKRAQDLLDKYK